MPSFSPPRPDSWALRLRAPSRALGLVCLLPPAAQWRWSSLVSALLRLVFGQIASDGGLRPAAPQLLPALLRPQWSALLTVSTCLDRPGLPHPSVAHLCPAASSVLPRSTLASAPALSPLLLVVGVAAPLRSQHASWPTPSAGPSQSHAGSSELRQHTHLAPDGLGLS